MSERIYKIISRTQWAPPMEHVPWADVDRADGYIHLSTASQVRDTARLHFAGRDDLHLLEIDPRRLLPGTLRWEPSRGGVLFPHVYGDIPAHAITRDWSLPRSASGAFIFPELGTTTPPHDP